MKSPDELEAGTERLMLMALSVVLGLSSAGALPLLLPWTAAPWLVLLSATMACLPLLAFALLRRFRRRSRLSFGSLLPGVLLSALGSGLVPLFLLGLYRGHVRVLNHGEEPFVLLVDGRRVARVEPSSGESALAGVELDVPAGEHELRVLALSDGRELFRAREQVEGGSPHLFAPLSSRYCFVIERRTYGDDDAPIEDIPLDEDAHFWRLPAGVAWFTPNPEPGSFRTSGGTLMCLRQRRCRHDN